MFDSQADALARAAGCCELCGAAAGLTFFAVAPREQGLMVCGDCRTRLLAEGGPKADAAHWRCLQESAWSGIPAVQVVAWRLLAVHAHEAWAQDLRDSLLLDDDTLAWAESAMPGSAADDGALVHRDAHGTVLTEGDSVHLIKDLDVKGAGFTAKRGTMVRGIRLVATNPEHIEGRVNGVQIVILTKFVKKV